MGCCWSCRSSWIQWHCFLHQPFNTQKRNSLSPLFIIFLPVFFFYCYRDKKKKGEEASGPPLGVIIIIIKKGQSIDFLLQPFLFPSSFPTPFTIEWNGFCTAAQPPSNTIGHWGWRAEQGENNFIVWCIPFISNGGGRIKCIYTFDHFYDPCVCGDTK